MFLKQARVLSPMAKMVYFPGMRDSLSSALLVVIGQSVGMLDNEPRDVSAPPACGAL